MNCAKLQTANLTKNILILKTVISYNKEIVFAFMFENVVNVDTYSTFVNFSHKTQI